MDKSVAINRLVIAILMLLILVTSVNALTTLKRINIRSCNSTGQILLYEGNNSFQIEPNVTFQTGYDQLLIPANTRYYISFDVKVDGISKPILDYWPNPAPKRSNVLLIVNTTPGSFINFSAKVAKNGTRGVMAFILQNSWNPVLLPSLVETHNNYSMQPTYLYPGKQNFMFFDKYYYNRLNSFDQRTLNVTVRDSNDILVFQGDYNSPYPVDTEGTVLSEFSIVQQDYYIVRVDTEDSIFWGTCMPHCGNGVIEENLGEECDDSNHINGDGCDSACRMTNCEVCDVKISPSAGCNGTLCSMNDKLNVSFKFTGASCHKPEMIQIDYYTGDKSCTIQRSGVDMYGINSDAKGSANITTCTTPSDYSPFDYIVPSVPDACAGKNLTNITVGIYSNNYTVLRSNGFLVSQVSGIVLDQCSQYGDVRFYKNLPIQAIYDPIDSCIPYTCHDYFAVSVFTNSSPFGVHIYNKTASSFDFYQCGADDGLCPDDFLHNLACGINGVCAMNSISDADCLQKTPMRCGSTFNVSGGNFVPSCIVPNVSGLPLSYGCANTSSCVYGNELNGSNPACYDVDAVISNKDGHAIQCVNVQNYWCPRGFRYDKNFRSCTKAQGECYALGCRELDQIWDIKYIPAVNTSQYIKWHAYLNNPKCFIVNNNTARRYSYCGLINDWPTPIFGWNDVGIVYIERTNSSIKVESDIPPIRKDKY